MIDQAAVLRAAMLLAVAPIQSGPPAAPPGPAAEAATPASSPPTSEATASAAPSSEVVVVGRAPAATDRFVGQMTQTRGSRQVARWNGPVCLRLLGLDKLHEAYVFGQMDAVAKPLKIELRGGSCHADIMIVFTRDMDRLTRFVIRRFPRLFQDTDEGVSFLAGMRTGLLNPRPVRWINASRTGPGVGGSFYDGVNGIYSASRLRQSTRENAYHSLALVDLDGMDRLSWAQLVDYLVMVTLANPSMDARYGDDTVMAMFRLRDEGRATPPGLTDGDRAFLRALYAASPTATAAEQRVQIGSMIAGSRRP